MAVEPGVRKAEALRWLEQCGTNGSTWREYAGIARIGHGQASAILSKLHAHGLAARLTHRRDGNTVYVLAGHVADRPTVPFHPNPKALPLPPSEIETAVLAWVESGIRSPRVLINNLVAAQRSKRDPDTGADEQPAGPVPEPIGHLEEPPASRQLAKAARLTPRTARRRARGV